MAKIRWLSGGESHGKGIIGIIEGFPANLVIDESLIQNELQRRQKGYGRGGRMKIESDKAQILSGIRFGKTLGSPITIFIENKDWANWQHEMQIFGDKLTSENPVTLPRPAHADLAGSLKYNQQDIRGILERASARETAIRVALGAIAKQFLNFFKIKIISQVIQFKDLTIKKRLSEIQLTELNDFLTSIEESPFHCGEQQCEPLFKNAIDDARQKGDSIGGKCEILALNVPIGLGSHIQWDRRLDGLISQAIMSIPAIKAVEIGVGVNAADKFGSDIHDEIFWNDQTSTFFHKTNHAGGIEGGISNGEPIIVTATMKPIPTLMKPLQSVNLFTKQAVAAHKERSDVCAVPSAAIVAEAMLALVLADQFCEKFGGDSMEEIQNNFLTLK